MEFTKEGSVEAIVTTRCGVVPADRLIGLRVELQSTQTRVFVLAPEGAEKLIAGLQEALALLQAIQ